MYYLITAVSNYIVIVNFPTSIATKWKGLVNGVSGLMCASLSSIDSSSTYEPPLSFRPHGAIIGNLSSSFLRYSALPREAVCTENLTPWSKLLPCGQKVLEWGQLVWEWGQLVWEWGQLVWEWGQLVWEWGQLVWEWGQ